MFYLFLPRYSFYLKLLNVKLKFTFNFSTPKYLIKNIHLDILNFSESFYRPENEKFGVSGNSIFFRIAINLHSFLKDQKKIYFRPKNLLFYDKKNEFSPVDYFIRQGKIKNYFP